MISQLRVLHLLDTSIKFEVQSNAAPHMADGLQIYKTTMSHYVPFSTIYFMSIDNVARYTKLRLSIAR